MPEFFEKLERKKHLKIKCDKKNKHSANKERRESREEIAKIKYRKQYFEHVVADKNEEDSG